MSKTITILFVFDMSKQFLGPKSRLQNRLLFHLSHKVISKLFNLILMKCIFGYLIPSISHITMVYTVEHILVIVDFFGLADKSKVAKQT